MTLNEYMVAKNISQAKMARRCGLSRSAVCLLIAGKRFPSPETMRRVFLATNGEVKADDFFNQAMQ